MSALHGSQLVAQRVTSECVGQVLRVEGYIASLPVRSALPGGGERQRFRFQADDIQPQRCAGPSRLLLSHYDSADLRAGQRWRFDVKLKKTLGAG